MSFRTTGSDPNLRQPKSRAWATPVNKCLNCVSFLAGFVIVTEMDGNDCRHVSLVEVKRCLSDDWDPPIVVLWLEELVEIVLVLPPPEEHGGGFSRRIWAEGFIRSSHRRIQLPRFRPTSMSLSCMFLWTLSATSNIARVRLLWINRKRTRLWDHLH